ncbi:MAG: S-adenosylmethionine:tRNA ribosyltransferase-isomerase [Candidatus Eremiobacteraeota bacterium]|nr:S-adenosylmethionine:tRNA ribosyltransferase-isomerase [Candidatus Eremiobacteraeota bacterium]
MPFAEALERPLDSSVSFELPPQLEAREPAEVRGCGRDDVRLLVTDRQGMLAHARFARLPDFLRPGDLIVLNQSATIPAALSAQRESGKSVKLHISTQLPADLFVVEPVREPMRQHERLRLAAGASAELLTAYRDSRRLWIARLLLPEPFLDYMGRHGRPITYRHMEKSWPLETYQNVYAAHPGSAEMASAGRPFTRGLLQQLRSNGVETAFITLHAGVASLERDEPPYEEAFSVPAEVAQAIRRTRRVGGRVIGVGTTVVRALESSLDASGRVVASQGWTDVVIGARRGVSTVDGMLTGFHEPKSSHLAMLEAIAGGQGIREAYRAALEAGYLWHEFGDSHLILPALPASYKRAA